MKIWTEHLTIGRVTIYGENAMNWVVNIRIKKGLLCFTLPTYRRIIGKDNWHIYLSPNGTPSESIWCYGYNGKYS